ncbi:N-acetylmuramoyl-L-alanine amidase [Streptomyces sp. NPDC012769]|uniref:peptidoglycan recognition protein family protein n=1 Tax=Streptomyces sp. NPDC012769 TaxID=3364848 RepID=UPI0036905695
MAKPMTPDQLIALLKEWGIPYKEYKNWKNHNRNHKGNWGPINGLMVHHTGSDAPDQRELLYSGHAALPGPLSQVGLDQQGVIHLIGNGRCNHAGLGDSSILKQVIAEDYGDTNLKPKKADTDGNAHFVGMEIWYSGNHDMTAAQYNTLRRFAAAFITFYKWTEKSVIGHGEWQPGKWDPGYKKGTIKDMRVVRRDIATTKKAGPKAKPPVVTPPAPPVAKTLEQRVAELEKRVTKLGG